MVEKVLRDTNDDGIWDTDVILFGITSDVPPPEIIEEIDTTMFFFFKQKTAYEIHSGDWSSDVCSSDLSGKIGQLTL